MGRLKMTKMSNAFKILFILCNCLLIKSILCSSSSTKNDHSTLSSTSSHHSHAHRVHHPYSHRRDSLRLSHHTLSSPSVHTAHHTHSSERKYRRHISTRERRDTGPVFEKTTYIATVPEEKERGYVVTTVSATDSSSTDLAYSLSALIDARSQSLFSIDSSSGVVTTLGKLDRESINVHYLKITCTNSAVPPKSSSVTLQVNVNDENDHSPTFEQSSYHASVKESISVGTPVITVRATDLDTGSNAEIEYSILNPTLVNEVFRIDSSTGIIYTRGPLDRESKTAYTLEIQATDLGPLTTRKTTQTVVHVNVLDDNDCWPQFTNKSYSVSVREDIAYTSNPIILKVTATDADEDLNAMVRYSIIAGNTQSHFAIEPLTGEISVTSPLDYETSRWYRLTIRAQDAGSPPRSNTTQVLINIIDVNDDAPKFYSSLFQESVLENSPKGHKVLHVQAFDSDDGVNAQLTYKIKDLESIPRFPFEIESNTGWIYATRNLDHEEGNLYEFTVIAEDAGTPSKSSTANVVIRIQDINDNDPVFDPKIYETVVSEIDPPGTPVITVTATDRDHNSRLNFQIANGNLRNRFNIVSQNNQGVIMVSQSLDYKTEKRFILSVLATDSGGRSDTATVYINVTDANTHRPVIEKTPYSVVISEDTPVGSTILVIEATDADVGENARITFAMDDVPEFKIDPHSGAISVIKPLDREKVAGYTVIVTAMDNGRPPLTDSANVEIEISDVNDNPPVFKQATFNAKVSEDTLIGTNVIQLTATDNDLGTNGQIKFALAPDHNGNDAFTIDATSGVIRTAKILDREVAGSYELKVVAYDKGSPPLSTTAIVTVIIEDVNDNPPRFKSEKLLYTIPENSPIGYAIGEVIATDADLGENAHIEYSIVGGPDATLFSLFARPHDKAELISRTDMDYESDKKIYYLTIRASSPPLRTDIEVEVYVTDVNDNAPILSDFSIVLNNYKNHFPFGVIGKVPVFDADVADKLTYRFTSGNNANLLFLNESTGEIKLNPSLNTNVPNRATFLVSISDGINEVQAQCQLITNLVTDAMLLNAVTLPLDRLSEKEFLRSYFDRFLEGLAEVIPSSKENIVLFSIIGSENGTLNVTFAVRRSDERSLNSFITSQYIQERIYLSRAILAWATGLDILPFDDSLCVREPCLNYETCTSVMKFDRVADFITTSSMLFRPVYPVKTFACLCPLGYSGLVHNYECDVEVNLCYSNPCSNGGRCEKKESGYTCICREGFYGKNCQFDLTRSSCSPGICKGSSYCTSTSSTDQPYLHSKDNSIRCANCSYAEWSTPICDLKTRTFTPNSYLTLPSLRQRNRFTISIQFASKQDNLLLLYNSRYNDQNDFVSLEIIDSILIFSFSLGQDVTRVTVTPPVGYLNNGQWHTVTIKFYNRTGTINLDDCDEGIREQRIVSGRTFYCSNSTQQLLSERCQDKMQSCYRFLDLTGPLQIGGLPPLPTEFQTTATTFTGCIGPISIDNQLIDLNSFVANNGTRPGCLEKRGFCHSFPCKNRGKCFEGWSTYTCQCADGYTGQDCSIEVKVRGFNGEAYLIFTPPLLPIKLNWLVKFSFKTFEKDGLLVALILGQNNRVTIDLINGYLRYAYNNEYVVIKNTPINDGKWHYVEANWMSNGIWLNLDYALREENREFTSDVTNLKISKVLVGGVDEGSLTLGSRVIPNLIGCIAGVDIGFGTSTWESPSVTKNVIESCGSSDHCISNPCPKNSDCVDLGMGKYTCKCHSGYIGSDCSLACELNACSSGSTCIPWNNTRGYNCLCDGYHTGTYCEESLVQVCPSSWWGTPVCGPCDCNTDKGYDANCNKTTGTCHCQVNHYQPENSDSCIPCNCYSIGSFGGSCDTKTGQCTCRHNSILGKQCDSCASAFAEVTDTGCEVIYDACPKIYSDNIWWERTNFGSIATQNCPPGSIGFATRSCTEADGWLPGDLHTCSSSSFSDINGQLSLIESNDLSLSPFVTVKLTHDLRSALNSSKKLYGQDIATSFKLLQLILTYESNQSGLNLTHKQDANFLPSIIEITSILLDENYATTWNRIRSDLEDGPESLIRSYQSYLEVLITNREDTFTHPFEINTENVIFGIDTISTDQLWEMQYLESFANVSHINLASAASPSLDISNEIGDAVVLPKYNNYPPAKAYRDDITRIILPLKGLAIPSASEILDAHIRSSSSFSSSSSSSLSRPFSKPTAVFGYTLFNSLSSLLPESFDYITVRNRISVPTRANTPIFTTVVRAGNSSLNFLDKIHPRINYRLRVSQPLGHNNPRCAYWTFEQKKSASGTLKWKGKWSAKGCELKATYPSNRLVSRYTYVNCSCDRIAPVAVLMDVTGPQALFSESPQQSIISYIGLTVSSLILAATLIILSALRGPSTNSNDIHRNIVLCLVTCQLLYLIGLKFRDALVEGEFSCKIVAILLTFFYMCTFSWLLIESLHLHRMVTEIRDINHGPMKFYYFAGYSVPAVIVTLSVGVKADQYGNYFYCWLSLSEPVIWTLIGPIAILITLTLIIFIFTIQTSVDIKESVISDYGNMRSLTWISFALLPMITCHWLLALLTVNDYLEDLYPSFYIIASITSCYICFGYCFINTRVRQNLKLTWIRWTSTGKHSNSNNNNFDENLSVTRVTMASRNAFHSPFESSYPRSIAVTDASTTSRSSTAKASSTYYGLNTHRYSNRKSHRKHRSHRRRHKKDDTFSESNPSLELASSHSSDADDGTSVGPHTQNEINSQIERNLSNDTGNSDTYATTKSKIINNNKNTHQVVENNSNEVTGYGRIRLTDQPYSRHNIIAMGLVDELSSSFNLDTTNITNASFNQSEQSDVDEGTSSRNSKSVNQLSPHNITATSVIPSFTATDDLSSESE